MMGPKKQIGKVVRKSLIAEKVYEVDIFLPEVTLFRSGQYVSVKVNDQGLRRSYSVVSYSDKVITLLVDVGPGGVGSILFEKINVGEEIEVMGFLGNFFVNRDDLETKKEIYFVATGTGVAPFLPMLFDLKERYLGKVVLWWGVRFVRRVYWQNVLERLKNDWSAFDYEMYVSKPETVWRGKVGRVGDDLDKVNVKKTSWYLCGSTGMIEQLKVRMIARGVAGDDVNYEKFF